MIARTEHREIREKALTWFEEGIEQGLMQGRRDQAGRSIEHRFGASDDRVSKWLSGWTDEQLDHAFDAIYRASSLEELLAAKPPSLN